MILIGISYSDAMSQYHPLRRFYVQTSFYMGGMMGHTKNFTSIQDGLGMMLCYKLREDLRLSFGYDVSAMLAYPTLRYYHDNIFKHVYHSDFEPSVAYGGKLFAITYMGDLFNELYFGRLDTYLTLGLSTVRIDDQPTWFYSSSNDGHNSIVANGHFRTSFASPFAEIGLYRKNKFDAPARGVLRFKFGVRYTYTPTLYHGTFNARVDGVELHNTMIMSGGYLSLVATFSIGGPFAIGRIPDHRKATPDRLRRPHHKQTPVHRNKSRNKRDGKPDIQQRRIIDSN
ncbi:MAG: hypothetical protein WDO14_23380 [Bacteroidota bacterium]